MGFNVLCNPFVDKIPKVLDIYMDTLVDLKLMVKGNVQATKFLPFGPCDGIKVNRWWKPSIVLNPMGLMHIGGHVHHLDGVLLAMICFYAIAFGLRLFDPFPIK